MGLACLTATPIKAQIFYGENQDVVITLPDFLEMTEVTGKANAYTRRKMYDMIHPNKMLAMFFPKNQDDLLDDPKSSLPNNMIMVSVTRGDPTITDIEWNDLRKTLRRSFKHADATVFKETPYWIGATANHMVNDRGVNKQFLFSTVVVYLNGKPMLVQYLRNAKDQGDVALLHGVMETIAEHLIKINRIEPVEDNSTSENYIPQGVDDSRDNLLRKVAPKSQLYLSKPKNR